MRARPTSSLALALVLVGMAGPAHAQSPEPLDTWSEPNPGLRYLRRTIPRPATHVHALVVDLDAPGVRVVATARGERWSTVSDFAARRGAVAGVNGGFWKMWQRPTGITAGDGALWPGVVPDPDFGHFGVRADGRAIVRAPGEGEGPRELARLTDALSGRPILVVEGRVAESVLEDFPTARQRQPRTAVGVSADGRRVILVVVDGRQRHSHGMRLRELAETLVELGAHRAINLDGGGSSVMFVQQAGGIVTSPSRGRWVRLLGLSTDESERRRERTREGSREVFVRGQEREVMNHLAVIAPRPPTPIEVQSFESALADGSSTGPVPETIFAAPERAPVRLGRWREHIATALLVGGPILPSGALALFLRRRLSRKRRRPNSS